MTSSTVNSSQISTGLSSAANSWSISSSHLAPYLLSSNCSVSRLSSALFTDITEYCELILAVRESLLSMIEDIEAVREQVAEYQRGTQTIIS